MAEVDKQDYENFMTLQNKVIAHHNRLSQLNSMMQKKDAAKKYTSLTLKQLSELPDDARMYKSVGRAYFMQPKKEICTNLEDECKASVDQYDQLAKSKETAQKAVVAAENEIRELLSASPALAQKIARSAR